MSRWRFSCGLHLSTAFQGSPLHRLTGWCRVFCLPGSLCSEAVTLSMVPREWLRVSISENYCFSQQQKEGKEVPAAGNERTEQYGEEPEETLAFGVVVLAESLALELWDFYSETEPDSSGEGPEPPAGAAASGSGVQSSAQRPLNLRQGEAQNAEPVDPRNRMPKPDRRVSACAVARPSPGALAAVGGGSSEPDVRDAYVSAPGRGGRRLHPPC
uniref:Uncharacterized protein n=1 Tax=Rangifer tarandus platyrhynchus TaxID=3082113 RepID=A0ACB0DWT0_RANTA|nr:unnamed protein product [Rangifer tarandus platyrhynchus]